MDELFAKKEDIKFRFGNLLSELYMNEEFDERDKADVLSYVKSIVDNNLKWYLEMANLLDEVEKEMGIE